jgi:hypothetical protein
VMLKIKVPGVVRHANWLVSICGHPPHIHVIWYDSFHYVCVLCVCVCVFVCVSVCVCACVCVRARAFQ